VKVKMPSLEEPEAEGVNNGVLTNNLRHGENVMEQPPYSHVSRQG
jgi:hypothetical protein